MDKKQKISIILPCLNEQKGLSVIIPEIVDVCEKTKLDYEIVLADNNSSDQSVFVFKKFIEKYSLQEKSQIILEKKEGYGYVYQSGFNNAKGDIFIMGDSDGTYDFNQIPNFIKKINGGYDLVIGNRFSGNMEKNSMPLLNKFLGNPILSFLVRLFFKVKVKDVHSGMRAIKKEDYQKLNLYTKGMEFASEMIIQASKKNMKICEIDIPYRNRHGHSKLKAFQDGWKHLRFILIYSPYYIFLIPGIIIFFSGLILNIIFYFYNPVINKIILQTHPMFFWSILIFAGYQLVFFAIFNKFYSINHLGDQDNSIQKLAKYLTLEKMILFGLFLMLLGIILSIYIIISWIKSDLTLINQTENLIWVMIFFTLSIQTIFSSLTISIIGIKEK